MIGDPWLVASSSTADSWQGPDSTAFSLRMTVVGSLLINDEASTHPDNIVAAFAGSELRGIAVPTVVDGHLVFVMTIFANDGGETIRFEAYDAAADRIRPVLETLTFSAGEVVGTPSSPLALTTSVDAPQASPALLSPLDREVDVALYPTMVWDAAPRAAEYQAAISTSDNFADSTAFANLSATSWEIVEPLAPATVYYWRARAVNTSGAGPWSESWQFTTVRSSVSTDRTDRESALRFSLAQNHLNPFNGRTEIRYELPRAAHVQLVLHAVLGCVVDTLVAEIQPAGSHSLSLDASGLGSDLYVYRLSAGALSTSRAMTVLR